MPDSSEGKKVVLGETVALLRSVLDPIVVVFSAMIAGLCGDDAAVGKEVVREA
jgi:hypothetical protein